MTPEQKEWIDNASYHTLLERVRSAPVGDPMFDNSTGVGGYYMKKLADKRAEVGPKEHVRVSKSIG